MNPRSLVRTALLGLLLSSGARAADEAPSDPYPGVNFSSGLTVLDKAPASKEDPTQFRALALLPTKVKSAKRPVIVTTLIGNKNTTEATMVDGKKDKKTTRETYIRLKLKPAKAHSDPLNMAVVVQSFAKEVGAEGALSPVETNVFLINIPEFGAAENWVDLPPMTTIDDKKTKTHVESKSAQSTSSGMAFLGVIVTAFDGTNIVFQAASISSLKDLGVTAIPSGPK